MVTSSKHADWDALVSFVISALPDSVGQRKGILRALINVLPAKYERRASLVRMLYTLEQHTKLQLEFPDFFKPGTEPAGTTTSQGTHGQASPNNDGR